MQFLWPFEIKDNNEDNLGFVLFGADYEQYDSGKRA